MTQTQEQTGFAPAPPKQEAITSNIGYVIDVGDTYKSEKSSYGYFVTPLTIHGMGAGKEQRVWLVFQPEWFKVSFKPATLTGKQGNPDNVYRANISDGKILATLEAISGEKYGELCSLLNNVPSIEDSSEEEFCTNVTQTFIDFFTNNKVIFGYVLGQKNELVDGQWIPSKYMSIQRYFVASEESLEKERMKARKTAERRQKAYDEKSDKVPNKYLVTFDDSPF